MMMTMMTTTLLLSSYKGSLSRGGRLKILLRFRKLAIFYLYDQEANST